MAANSSKYLFGGSHPWTTSDWTSVDDRVRGGASQSFLIPSQNGETAVFSGNLDIKTLGGAGFASQRTTDDRSHDLSSFDGLELDIDTEGSDQKQYTLTLKDEILPKRPDGREQSTVSWEFDFTPRGKVSVKWDDLKPTYRGKEVKDAKPLDLENVKRMSLMMRSFFGEQEGEFRLAVRSIKGWNDGKELDEKRGDVAIQTREIEESIYGDVSSCCVIL
ncbi:complex I intermediate-associated protein 30-domain-containing protein [Aspergillus unguis]